MTFIKYLESKKQLLIWWFAIHFFALFVNLAKIEGDVSRDTDKDGYKDYTSTRLLSTTPSKFDRSAASSSFWPFVGFFKSNVQYNPYLSRKEDFSSFNGVFYKYDFSEFLAYAILIFLILYIKWNSKHSKKTMVNTNS